MEYASKGVANTALGLSIGSLGIEALRGGLGGLFGGAAPANAPDGDSHLVSRYEAGQAARIAELETEVKLRDANTYTDQKMMEMYKYTDGRLRSLEEQLCQQRVINAQVTANIGCMQNQINALAAMTKTYIPIGNVAPEPMPLHNSWTAPTTTAPAT